MFSFVYGFFLPNITSMRLTHIVISSSSLLFFIATQHSSVWTYTTYVSILLLVDSWAVLSLGTIINNAFVNTVVHVIQCTHVPISEGYIPSSRTVES